MNISQGRSDYNMGFCSWISSKVKSAVNEVKKVAQNVYEGVKSVANGFVEKVKHVAERVTEAAKTVKQKVTNVFTTVVNKIKDGWDEFTGRKKFNEAKERYNKLDIKYNEKNNAYKTRVAAYSDAITQIVNNINAEKKYIINTLFVRMKNVLSKIKYDNKFSLEYFKMPNTKVEALRKTDDLFLIDFDKNPIKTTLQAIFSLGFWTRKKATETLDRIMEEEKKAEVIYSKMDADLNRLDLLQKTLEQTLFYLKDMEAMYENIIYKANNTAKYLRFKCMQFTHGISQEYCKLSALPKADQELMFALFNFTTILDKVLKMEIIGQDSSEINNYRNKIELRFKECRETVAA